MTHKLVTFDDLLITPEYSEVEREDINIRTTFFNNVLEVPVISSPMDTVTGFKMVSAINHNGGFGFHHRYCSENVLENMIAAGGAVAVSPSMGLDKIISWKALNSNLTVVLDVAHGNTRRNLDFCSRLVSNGINVVSGNIATRDAAMRYLSKGIIHLRVGIGGGSVCTTRQVTGVGVPQAQAIMDIAELKEKWGFKIISDGGHKTTGDIVKALVLGADYVMLGGMLAGTDEAEGGLNYRGMASETALMQRKKEFFVEGTEKSVQAQGPVRDVLKEIKQAIEQACYYVGASNLKELQEAAVEVISSGAQIESFVR